jgi:death on curing protein
VTLNYLTVEWVVAYHHEVMLRAGSAAVLIAADKLESALYRPQAEAFGGEAFPTIAEKAAVLLQGIVIAHPFMDGNKRAGVGAMLSFLELNGVALTAPEEPLYDFVIAVTTGELREVGEIAAQVRDLFSIQ